MAKEEKYFCTSCNKFRSKRNFYKNVLESNNHVCIDCIQKEFLNLCIKYNSEASALLFICNKYNITYNYQAYEKIKHSTERSPFRTYVVYSKTLIKYNTHTSSTSKSTSKSTFKEMKQKFDDYLYLNNIQIQDIFSFNYELAFKDINLEFDKLDFIVNYYNHRYPAYKFKLLSETYYENKTNLIFELKYFIETDKKISISDIPYIFSLKYLNDNNISLYNVILKGTIYTNLFDWINDCYPNKFKKSQFNNKSISFFNSNEEQLVNAELIKNFKNVLYNKKSIIGIKLYNMIPDWFIFTKNGVILVEYFGLFVDNPKTTIEIYYHKHTLDKINKYKTFRNYIFLFIYPKDLVNNFEGFKTKINNLKGKLDITN